MAIAASEDLERLVRREHANPHGVLGAHPTEGGVVVRAFRPAAASVKVVTADGETARARAGPPRRHLRGRRSTAPSCRSRYQLEVDYGDAGTITIDDPYRFLPTIGELDLHLARRGPPRGDVDQARRARAGDRRRARHGVRGLGAVGRAGLRRRRLQLLGRPRAPDARARRVAGSGSCSCPASRPARATSTRSSRRTARSA